MRFLAKNDEKQCFYQKWDGYSQQRSRHDRADLVIYIPIPIPHLHRVRHPYKHRQLRKDPIRLIEITYARTLYEESIPTI